MNIAALAVVPLFLFGSVLASSGVLSTGAILAAGIASAAVLGYLTLRHIQVQSQFELHQQNMAAYAARYRLELQSEDCAGVPAEFQEMSLSLIADREVQTIEYLKAIDWNYIDLSYATYQRTKYGEYKAATIFYGVMVTELPRVLPNVFFDSKTQGGRQYKAKFSQEQLHSLEGNFDTYFDTYFAPDYTIDSLSFVTPDVMEALIAASEFDIEIVGDKLFLYGPVYVNAEILDDIAGKLLKIHHTLQVTAKAYRDDRLPAAMRAHAVTPLGMFLKRRKKPIWPAIVAVLAYIIIELVRTYAKQ